MNAEKNGLNAKVPEKSGEELPWDKVLVTFTFYHPVHKFKTQEWLITEDNTFEDLHQSVQCLANFCEFGVGSEKVVFRIGEAIIKNLKTEISQIPLKIGEIYTYLHKGICQHDMIVSDIRLLNKNDPQSLSHYPFCLFSSKTKRRTCELCSKSHAKFVLFNNRLIPIAFLYLCENCLNLFETSTSEVYPYLYD